MVRKGINKKSSQRKPADDDTKPQYGRRYAVTDQAVADVPESMRALVPANLQTVATTGDGACGVHAVFADTVVHGKLFHPTAREDALRWLGPTYEHLRGADTATVQLQALGTSLWSEFVIPQLSGRSTSESALFWEALKSTDAELAEETASAFVLLRFAGEESQARMAEALGMSRLFFTPEMDLGCVRPLAEALGYIPWGLDVLSVGQEDLEQSRREGDYEYGGLAPAMGADGFVRGTRLSCNDQVPSCNYAALFDGRPMFDAIRVAFMRAADPTMTLNTFTDSLKKLVDQARRVRFGAPCVLACMLSLQQRAPRQVILDFPG